MFQAIQEGHSGNAVTIRKLIRVHGFDVDSEIGPIPKERHCRQKVPRCHTSLTWAAWQGKLSLVKCLLEEGANPNALTSQGLAAIHCCCMKSSSEHLAVLKYFLESPRLKLSVDFCNEQDGTTPLMYASMYGSFSAAEYLLQQNAEVNRQDWEGKSALFYAVRGGHLDLVQLLVAHNACVYLRDNKNATVLHHLLITFVRSKIAMSTLIDILTYVVENIEVSIHTAAHDGSTALHVACHNGLTDVVSYLLGRGAKLEAKKNGWETPLWTLIMGPFPRSKLIMLLLEKGANFEARHCLGMTLIQYAKLVLKNEKLVGALEDAQRALRAKRMKACLAKRKEILSFSSSIKCVDGGTPTYSPFLSLNKDVMMRWTEQSMDNAYHNDGGLNSSSSAINAKPIIMEKVKVESAGTVAIDSKDHEAYSSISSDSFPSESEEENLDDEDNGCKKQCTETSKHLKSSKESIVDHDDLERVDERNNNVLLEKTPFIGEIITLSDDDSSALSSDEDNDLDSTKFDALPTETAYPYGSDIQVEKLMVVEKPTFSSFSVPLPSRDIGKSGSLDVKECFERLLRKKRLFEEANGQAYKDNAGGDDEGNEEKVQAQVPQKIQRVRRSAIILSDSD